MKIIVVSNTCSEEEFKHIQSIKYDEKISPQQNFFSSLIKGLLENKCEVTCITTRSIASNNCNEKSLNNYEEIISNDLKYIYTKIINKSIIRNINNYLQVRKEIRKLKNEKDIVVLFDPLAYDSTLGMLSGMKNSKIKKIAIITDIPTFIADIGKNKRTIFNKMKSKIKQLIFEVIIKSADGFCFLTKYMNDINKKKLPYIVVEGISNAETSVKKEKNSFPVIMYAGGLYEKFGTRNLVDAVNEIDNYNFELHIYGEGNCITYIKEISQKNKRIKYNGVVSVEEIKDLERKATILINPRPDDEEYTKYSFPSKTLEYMSSGTPVLTTKLKGIPDEYFKYVYLIEKSDKEGIKEALISLLSKSNEELYEKGKDALKFVKENKNSKIQAKKIIDLLRSQDDQ